MKQIEDIFIMDFTVFLLLAALLNAQLATITANVNQCHSDLLKACFCGKVYDSTEIPKTMFVVNCTNTGFTSTAMLENLPEQTQKLIFTGNHIPILEMNVFGELVDLSELKIIDLSNNGIREIKGKAFHHIPSVERLILNHNNISISTDEDKNFHHPRVFSNFYNLKELHLTNAFADNTDAALADDLHDIFVYSNLTKLYKIHLEQNEIKYFHDANVFCDLPDLHDIYLGDNNIPNLNFNINCLKKLRYLDLEENNITRFSQRDLDAFDQLAPPYRKENFTLQIRGNPFRCDQAIKVLHDWLFKTKVNVMQKDGIDCHQAKYGTNHIVNLIQLVDAKNTRMSQAVAVLLIVSGIVLFSIVAAFVYLNKEKAKVRLAPIVEALTRKVQYTTIETQDV